jgi:predicted NUDIX family NTP pyrophosphohydrolase
MSSEEAGGMPKRSAGLLMYRRRDGGLEIFLVHPGGPFWENKDAGAWTIPKGECGENETPIEAARREFAEETGFVAEGNLQELGSVKQSGGKIVHAWAMEGDCDPADLRCITCEFEWPPRSGKKIEIPEVDRGAWFSIPEARERILKGQAPLLDRLCATVGCA